MQKMLRRVSTATSLMVLTFESTSPSQNEPTHPRLGSTWADLISLVLGGRIMVVVVAVIEALATAAVGMVEADMGTGGPDQDQDQGLHTTGTDIED